MSMKETAQQSEYMLCKLDARFSSLNTRSSPQTSTDIRTTPEQTPLSVRCDPQNKTIINEN